MAGAPVSWRTSLGGPAGARGPAADSLASCTFRRATSSSRRLSMPRRSPFLSPERERDRRLPPRSRDLPHTEKHRRRSIVNEQPAICRASAFSPVFSSQVTLLTSRTTDHYLFVPMTLSLFPGGLCMDRGMPTSGRVDQMSRGCGGPTGPSANCCAPDWRYSTRSELGGSLVRAGNRVRAQVRTGEGVTSQRRQQTRSEVGSVF